MVFNGTDGLVQDIDFICGTDSTSYPLADKARNCNRHYYVAVSDAIKAIGRNGPFDDENLGSLPATSFDLVDNQHEYKLRGTNGKLTTLLKVHAVEIKDSAGNTNRIQPIDTDDLRRSITDFENTKGVPKYYDLRGNYIYLYPAPSSTQVTLTNGITVHHTREVDAFTSADTTQEPGFAEPYHRIISLGAAYDYLVKNDTSEKANSCLAQYQALRNELRTFYADLNRDSQIRLRPILGTGSYL